MIFLNRLRIQDFKSYQDEEIEFIPGKNVIHGQNGAGKTTILLAILYALLGRVQRLGKLVPKKDLIRKGKNSFTIELEFEIDGVEYVVQRTNYVGTKEPIAKLWKNGDLICEKQSAVTLEIAELLGIDSTTFENVVYIGQGEIPQIAIERAGWRKKIFDQFLNLTVYTKVFENFRGIITNTDSEIKYLDTRIKDLKKDTSTLSVQEKNLAESQGRLKKRKAEEIKYNKKFQTIQKEFQQEDEKRVAIELLATSQKDKLDQIKKIKNTISKKQVEIEKILGKKVSLEEPDLKKLLDSHKKLKNDYEEQEKQLVSVIKTQEKSASDLKSIESRIEDNKKAQKSNQVIISNSKEHILTELPELKSEDYSIWSTTISLKLEKGTTKIKQLKSEREDTIKKEKLLTTLDAEHRSKEKAIETSRNNLKKYEIKITKIDANWEKSLKVYSAIDFDTLLEKQKIQLNQQRTQMKELSNQKAVLDSRLKEKNTELKQFNSLKEGVKCPECKQTVTGTHKTEIIEEIKTQITKIKSDIEKLVDQISKNEQELTDIEEEKHQIEKKFTTFQKLKPLVESITSLKAQIKTDTKEIQELKSKIGKVVIKKSSEQCDSEISTENDKILLNKNLVTKLESINASQESLNELLEKESELEGALGNILKDYAPVILEKSQTELKQIKNKMADENKLIPSVSNLIERVSEKNTILIESKKIQSELDQKKKEFDIGYYHTLMKEKDQISQKIGEVKNDIQTLTKELIPLLEQKIEEMKEKLIELKDLEQKLQRDVKKSALIKIIREFTKQITPVLRQQKTTQITAKATEIFLDLVGDSGEFDGLMVTENYDLYVKRYGVDEDITILSGGEQIISCLAIRLAISETLANQGLILLDEPTSHLDDTHVKDLVEVFQYYSPVRQLITVTHDDEFEKIADSLIQVYKENGVSQIL